MDIFSEATRWLTGPLMWLAILIYVLRAFKNKDVVLGWTFEKLELENKELKEELRKATEQSRRQTTTLETTAVVAKEAVGMAKEATKETVNRS